MNEKTQQTKDTVDAFFAGFGAGDLPATLELFTDRVDFRVSGDSRVPWTGERSSKDEIKEFFGMFGTLLTAPESFEITGTIVQDGDAVVLADCVFGVVETGKKFHNRYALHFGVEDGRITRYHMYEDSFAIAEAFRA
jgi:ketosteroid isomerase-like protein